MTLELNIGDFARMTHLSVKALRHYHELGLLVPATVDRFTGYRHYDLSQVATAQVIRRLRDLGLPLDDIARLLEADDLEARNRVIVEHLARMERQLAATRATVQSLRRLLEAPGRPDLSVEYRRVPVTSALVIEEEVGVADFLPWWGRAFGELHAALKASGAERAGPDAALYFQQFFEQEYGPVVAFLPVRGEAVARGRVRLEDMPAVELAVTVHVGPYEELDQAYAALGAHVAERAIGVEGPIRETYLVTPFDIKDPDRLRTEVGWPVFLTG